MFHCVVENNASMHMLCIQCTWSMLQLVVLLAYLVCYFYIAMEMRVDR